MQIAISLFLAELVAGWIAADDHGHHCQNDLNESKRNLQSGISKRIIVEAN